MSAATIGFRKYNPGFLPDSEIVSRFVVRQPELDSLLGLLRGNDGPFNQHALVLGPRGFGKSHLVHRVAAECRRDEALQERWLPVVFAEESYQVASLGELWAEAVDRLSLATGEARWEGIATELRKERDERRLAARALATLLELADTRKQRLLIIIENLDQLMEDGGLPSDDAWSLRKTLQNEPCVMLLVTAVHRFEGIEKPDQALFDLFYRVELAALTARECSQLWLATTGEDLGVRRARSLSILAGGNPRLIVALASFARGRKLAELLVDFDELIDDWTDYFKGNIEAMPPQLRRVFLSLAELWRPSPARVVAEAARMPVNEASAGLQRLTSQGRVTITRTQGKSHYYQVSERLYNIYYLMRRRGPGAARVRALLDFVRHMFGPEDRKDLVAGIAQEACLLGSDGWGTHAGLLGALLHDARGWPDDLRDMVASIPEELFSSAELRKQAKEALKKPAALIELLRKPNGGRWLDMAYQTIRSADSMAYLGAQAGKVPLAPRAIQELTNLAIAIAEHKDVTIRHITGVTVWFVNNSYWPELEQVTRQILKMPDCCAFHITYPAGVLIRRGEPDRAALLLDGALTRWPTDVRNRRLFARALEESVGPVDHQRVIKLLSEILIEQLDPSDIRLLGQSLCAVGRPEEARHLAVRAVQSRSGPHGDLWRALRIIAEIARTSIHDAQIDFTALVGDSKEAVAWRELAVLCIDNPTLSLGYLDRAKALEPLSDEDYWTRAVALFALTRFEDAAKCIDDAIASLSEVDRADENLTAPMLIWWNKKFEAEKADKVTSLWAARVLTGVYAKEQLPPLLDRFDSTVSALSPIRSQVVADLMAAGRRDLWPRGLSLISQLTDPSSRRLRARLRGALEGPAAALEELRPLFLDRDVVSTSLDAAQADTIRLAAAGLLRPTLDLLLSSPAADLIEPLIVALQRKLGETVDAPIEVSEVAEVIERRIDALRETGDIWRADPLTIPLPDELP